MWWAAINAFSWIMVRNSNPAGDIIPLMTGAIHCTDPFIVTLPSKRYDVNTVERDIKHQIIMMHSLHRPKERFCHDAALLIYSAGIF